MRRRKSYAGTSNKRIGVAKLKICIGSILFLVMLLVGLFGSQLRTEVQATDTEEIMTQISYKSICIEPGDTLTSIAEEYMMDSYDSVQEYRDEIYRLNNLRDTRIRSGAYLVIPCIM